MLRGLVKIGEPAIGYVDVTNEDGSPVPGSPRRYLAVMQVKFLDCGCEHRVQTELSLPELAAQLGKSGLKEGRIKQRLIAECRRMCRERGCPEHDQGMARLQ